MSLSTKERLDSLLSYQKKLYEIMTGSEAPEIGIRAIAELHRIEMSLHSLFKELPQFDSRPDSTSKTIECNCSPDIGDIITHSKFRYCNKVWCPMTLNQNWCPNPVVVMALKDLTLNPGMSIING